MFWTLLHVGLALLVSPLLLAVINRVKAFWGCRQGQSLLQPYRDLIKLLRKGAVYSHSTSFVFKTAPAVGLAGILLILLLIPYGNFPAVFSFNGDLILVVYIMGLLRFFTVIAALDTASAFAGMGASREMQFALFTELAGWLSLAALAKATGSLSLSGIFTLWAGGFTGRMVPVMILTGAALFIVLLAENSRIPIDDPDTHLELTMIHEVIVLDYCGVDLALIQYTAGLKFWVWAVLLVSILQQFIVPAAGINFLLLSGGLLLVALLTGITESIMARLRLNRVPQLLTAALVFAVLALIIPVR